MKTTMADKASSLDFSSSSKKHFHWTIKVENQDDEDQQLPLQLPTLPSQKDKIHNDTKPVIVQHAASSKKKFMVSRLRSVLATSLNKIRPNTPLGPRVVGTLFGSRNGHVHFAFQKDPASHPAFLIELATPISGLVKEMASGLVRIALECNKKQAEKQSLKLLEEPIWRTYCNGKRCGFGSRRECGAKEWKVLKSVMMISMGAGVLPGSEDDQEDEVMYMRAKFERVVGSRDSEAFYMMNPEINGAPELSIYLLRV